MDALVLQTAALVLTVVAMLVTVTTRLIRRGAVASHDALTEQIERLARMESRLDEQQAEETSQRLAGILDDLDDRKRLAIVGDQSANPNME